jgi:hypothetical protein
MHPNKSLGDEGWRWTLGGDHMLYLVGVTVASKEVSKGKSSKLL